MIKIIETNYDIKANSFQSRVIEVESWDCIIEQFKSDENIPKTSYEDYIGGYCNGVIRPQQSKIENLEYDNRKLICDVVLFNGRRVKKLISWVVI